MTVRVLLEPFPSYRRRRDSTLWVRRVLLIFAICALSYTGYVYVDSALYQAREERILDVPPPTVAAVPDNKRPPAPTFEPSLIGRISIDRLNVRAIVKEGVDSKTLRRAVGHVPGTAMPGDAGNVALAGHRDTFFRGLKDVRKNDRIQVQTMDHEYEYVVDSTKIVQPSDVHLLKPTKDPVLTLVTCYPFYYVGNAPQRFVVRARQVAVSPRESRGS